MIQEIVFSPDNGLYIKGLVDFYSSSLGGDKDFINYRTKAFYYHSLDPKLVLGHSLKKNFSLYFDRKIVAIVRVLFV